MKNEETLTILGFYIPLIGIYVGWGCWKHEGEPAHVIFNADKILKYRKWLIGFWHSHPNMLNYPSSTDIPTMYTWCNAIGKELFCMIEGVDAEFMSDPYLDKPVTLVGNYLFKTYPTDDRENKMKYVGHAHRIGRLFVWNKQI